MVLDHEPIDRVRFNRARDTLIHRGPDFQDSRFLANDCIGLGHTRLAIVDLSSNGNQPMQKDDLWVVQNGEIYNYPQLRRELEAMGCIFKSNSDTEVLLHGYAIWGERLCKKLEGMFAFAIWDNQKEELFVGRDHFGQKPLYYHRTENQLVIASEIKAIKAFARQTLPLRRASIADMLVHDFVPEPDTWYEDVKSLPAGHQMLVKRRAGKITHANVSEYWNFRPDPNPAAVSLEDAVDGLHHEINNAIESHLLADVEIGGFLSGGIDSSAIVTLAQQKLSSPIKTFSIGYGQDDEIPVARETARLIGANHHEGAIDEADFRAASGEVLRVFDHPFTDTSLVPMALVSRLAAAKVKVVLTGDGGDECFGGYDYGKYLGPGLSTRNKSSWKDHAKSAIETARWMFMGSEAAASFVRAGVIRSRRLTPRLSGFVPEKLLCEMDGYDPSLVYEKHADADLDNFRNAQWVGIKVPLPNKMLAKVDRSSMQFALETRAPFLAPRLVEYALNLPRSITNPKNDPFKGLLKKTLNDIVRYDVLYGAKRGFSLPKSWTQFDQSRYNDHRELFPKCVEAGLIKGGAWQQMRSLQKHTWRFAQLEEALTTGDIGA
ncbi:MAG: asparagine synthase (glutamine-hydrolyzing) [Pseudomonadota bacterium]